MENELQQARQTFITESRELLQDMEDALLILENSPDDQDTINSLFRSAHTIKGASGILGLDEIERFTHVVESLLSLVRENEIKITGEIIEVLLECRDHISGLVEIAASEAGVPQKAVKRGAGLIEKLNAHLGAAPVEKAVAKAEQAPVEPPACDPTGAVASTDAWHISLRFGPDALRAGMDPASFIGYLPKLGEIASLTAITESIPPADEMDPESCYLGFEIDFMSDFDKKSIEDVFEFVREDCDIYILPPHSRIQSYVELIEALPEDVVLLGEILIKGGALTNTELQEALALQKAHAVKDGGADGAPRIGEIMVEQGMVHPEVVDAALEKQKKTQVIRSRESNTIRIDAGKLDELVDLVGELVISTAAIGQHAQRIEDAPLTESSSIMMRLVEELRDSTMKARMVPIGDTFSRFNRMVRDMSRDIGKEIDLVISGGETELDKTVVERINDPLIHLVRNAADHGIEDPEVRRGKGKPERGKIRLNALHDAGCIVIEVSDDGKGLNRDRILEKAVSAGLAAPGQPLTDREIFNLVFEPGFSTAEKVTKLSGRG
ncbi:MAG: chemotaxis protein CheA, partial [Deltaproteobacteria bacterium]|nr:chemotaxis protein CheA [Deltaproteobacteria bacterium]